jgi:hypothetical protein
LVPDTKTDPNDPYSIDLLTMKVVPRSGIDTTKSEKTIKQITKRETEITPKIHFLDFETLLEQAGGLKFQEIVDSRTQPT